MNNVRFFLLLSVVLLSANFASAFELKMPVLPSVVMGAVSGLNASVPSPAVQQFSQDSIKLSVAQLHEKTTLIDGYLQSSLLAVLNSLASQEQVVALKKEQALIAGITNPKEKRAKEEAFQQSLAAAAQVALNDVEAKKKFVTLAQEKKSSLLNASYNLGLAGLGYGDILLIANDTLQLLMANPANALGLGSEISFLKNVATSLPPQAKTVGSISSNLIQLLKANKVTVPVADKTSKPKPVNF